MILRHPLPLFLLCFSIPFSHGANAQRTTATLIEHGETRQLFENPRESARGADANVHQRKMPARGSEIMRVLLALDHSLRLLSQDNEKIHPFALIGRGVHGVLGFSQTFGEISGSVGHWQTSRSRLRFENHDSDPLGV